MQQAIEIDQSKTSAGHIPIRVTRQRTELHRLLWRTDQRSLLISSRRYRIRDVASYLISLVSRQHERHAARSRFASGLFTSQTVAAQRLARKPSETVRRAHATCSSAIVRHFPGSIPVQKRSQSGGRSTCAKGRNVDCEHLRTVEDPSLTAWQMKKHALRDIDEKESAL